MPKAYTTISGDMWDIIAYRQMGSCMHMDRLIRANAGYAHIFVFPAGIALTIPDMEEAEGIGLPPWKSGVLG